MLVWHVYVPRKGLIRTKTCLCETCSCFVTQCVEVSQKGLLHIWLLLNTKFQNLTIFLVKNISASLRKFVKLHDCTRNFQQILKNFKHEVVDDATFLWLKQCAVSSTHAVENGSIHLTSSSTFLLFFASHNFVKTIDKRSHMCVEELHYGTHWRLFELQHFHLNLRKLSRGLFCALSTCTECLSCVSQKMYGTSLHLDAWTMSVRTAFKQRESDIHSSKMSCSSHSSKFYVPDLHCLQTVYLQGASHRSRQLDRGSAPKKIDALEMRNRAAENNTR